MTKKIINCETDWYNFHGDTIRYAIYKLENIAKLYGDSARVSCPDDITFQYSREETDEETDEEYEVRLKKEERNLRKRKAQYEKLKREFGESESGE